MDNSENILRDKKTKNLIPLFTILIILISALILYVSYNVFFGMTPKQYYTNIINNIYEKGKEITDKYDNSRYLNETSIIDGELTLDSNMPGFEEYKNYKLNYNFGIDYKNKKVQLGAGLADNSKTLIDLYTYIEKELLYLKSNTIFSDIISFKDIVNITESDDSENKEISSDDLNYILMKTKDSIINSLDDKDFTTSRDKIMISNKETNVKKISYILDKEKDKKILNNIVNTYKSDDRILDILSKASSSSKEEIKKQFDNYKVEGSDYNVAFNIYVNKNRIVKYEIYNINDDSNKFELLVDNNIYTINNQSTEVIINKKKDNNYLIELNNAGQRIANINYNKENDNKILINYDCNIDKNIKVHIIEMFHYLWKIII